jgi:hypothetical protein
MGSISAIDLFVVIVVSAIGLGYSIYGKKNEEWIFFGAGVAMMLFPYFVHGIFALILGVALAAAPFLIRR